MRARRLAELGLAVLVLAASAFPEAARAEEVDLQLVLAVDVSLSMDLDEQAVQRAGYVAAFRDREVIEAIQSGPTGRIAVAYLEWAGVADQHLVVDWTLVDGPETAEGFATLLESRPMSRWRRTSISSALLRSLNLIETGPHPGLRRVIDVSGDGANNQGPIVTDAREEVLARGVTINGLPLMLKQANPYSTFDMSQLDLFYEDCVIGGPGAFMIPVREVEEFPDAIRAKLILEIAGLPPPAPLLRRVQAVQRPPCDVGERQWRGWMYNGYQ